MPINFANAAPVALVSAMEAPARVAGDRAVLAKELAGLGALFRHCRQLASCAHTTRFFLPITWAMSEVRVGLLRKLREAKRDESLGEADLQLEPGLMGGTLRVEAAKVVAKAAEKVQARAIWHRALWLVLSSLQHPLLRLV